MSERLKTFFQNLFRVNPIIVKEVRSRMRGPRAFITLTVILLGMGGLMYAMLQLILASSRYSSVLSPQVGQTLFAALAFMELFMICAITPAVTAGAISSEKEKQTYEMLMSTPLSPTSILWGKLISALSYIFLLLFAGIPLASVVFIFGGVALSDMLKALLVLIVFAVAFGILGLFMSALFGRTGRSTVASFIAVVLLMVGPLFLAALTGVIRQSEPPRWLLAPSPISTLSAALASSMGQGRFWEYFLRPERRVWHGRFTDQPDQYPPAAVSLFDPVLHAAFTDLVYAFHPPGPAHPALAHPQERACRWDWRAGFAGGCVRGRLFRHRPAL